MTFRKYARLLATFVFCLQLWVLVPAAAWAEYTCESFLVELDPSKPKRDKNPSDHWPVVITFDAQKLLVK